MVGCAHAQTAPKEDTAMTKRLLILVCTLMCICTEALAEQRVHVGARAGLLSRSLTIDQKELTFTNATGNTMQNYDNLGIESHYGFNAAFVFRARVWKSPNPIDGASLFIELDAEYGQNNLVMEASRQNNPDDIVKSKVTFRTIDVPLVLCLKASVVRLCAGPVWHAYQKYELTNGSTTFDGVNPLCGYTLGIGFDFGKITLDGRYCGEFVKNNWNAIKGDASAALTGRMENWSIGLGLAF